MVNLSELLINLVRMVVPKLLVGINQKVCGRDNSLKGRVTSSWTAGG